MIESNLNFPASTIKIWIDVRWSTHLHLHHLPKTLLLFPLNDRRLSVALTPHHFDTDWLLLSVLQMPFLSQTVLVVPLLAFISNNFFVVANFFPTFFLPSMIESNRLLPSHFSPSFCVILVCQKCVQSHLDTNNFFQCQCHQARILYLYLGINTAQIIFCTQRWPKLKAKFGWCLVPTLALHRAWSSRELSKLYKLMHTYCI